MSVRKVPAGHAVGVIKSVIDQYLTLGVDNLQPILEQFDNHPAHFAVKGLEIIKNLQNEQDIIQKKHHLLDYGLRALAELSTEDRISHYRRREYGLAETCFYMLTTDEVYMTLGERLFWLCLLNCMSHSKLAKASGIDKKTIKLIEKKDHVPSSEVLIKLSEALPFFGDLLI